MAGGWAMLPILICSAVALAIVLERCWTLRRRSVLPPGLGEEVRNWARSGQLDPSHLNALAGGSPLGELLASALAVRNRSRDLPQQGEVYELYIKPEYQGVGFGSRLFAAARQKLKSHGLKGLVVWALEENSGALDFYTSAGGRDVAEGVEVFDQKALRKVAFIWD